MKNQTRGVGVCIGVVLIVWMAAVWSHKADAGDWQYSEPPTRTDEVLSIHTISAYNFDRHEFGIGCIRWSDGEITVFAEMFPYEYPLVQGQIYNIDIGVPTNRTNIDGIWKVMSHGESVFRLLNMGGTSRNIKDTLSELLNGIDQRGGIRIILTHPNEVKEVLSWDAGNIGSVKYKLTTACDPSNQSHLGRDVVEVPMVPMPSAPAAGGDTPLHTAIRRRDIDSVRSIVSVSDKPTLCRLNHLGQTPYALASILDFLDASLVLIAADATTGDCR